MKFIWLRHVIEINALLDFEAQQKYHASRNGAIGGGRGVVVEI